MRIVMKFGGSLLASRKGARLVADIVERYSSRNQIVVVVSAIGDTTDRLLEAAEGAVKRGRRGFVGALRDLQKTTRKAIEATLDDAEKVKLQTRTGALQKELGEILEGISILGELSPRSRDLTVSYGERIAAPIVAAELRTRGVDSTDLTGGEAGIVTDDSFGEARPDMKSTRMQVRRALMKRLARGEVPVICGFIARSRHGDITTLGRGGSDYTATIIASALDADEVWVYTDVDGIMTGDPRVVRNPRIVPSLSYAEAEELAFFGAKNMHPLALGPAREGRIPVRIKNGFRPNGRGTLITSEEKRSGGVVKCVAVVKNVGLLTVAGEALQGRPGIASRVFQALAAAGVNVLMISQSVSEANISMVVRRKALKLASDSLKTALVKEGIAATVRTDPTIAVVAAVGAGMRGTKGVAASLFHAVASKGVNVRMIAQGSSELNISFVVDSALADRATRAAHQLVAAKG